MASSRLVAAILTNEGLFNSPVINKPLTTSEQWELEARIKRQLDFFEKPEKQQQVKALLANLWQAIPHVNIPKDGGDSSMSLPFFRFIPDPAATIERIMGVVLGQPRIHTPLPNLWLQLERNLHMASGFDNDAQLVTPTKAKKVDAETVLTAYLGNTPFIDFFLTPIPFSIPHKTRFSHTHIVGGSGHGKTELLKNLLIKDIPQVVQGKRTVIVIDSQGELIKSITYMAELQELSDRLVLIDPTNDYSPALNVFDFGLERYSNIKAQRRRRLLTARSGCINISSVRLLRSELTTKQELCLSRLHGFNGCAGGKLRIPSAEFVEDTG